MLAMRQQCERCSHALPLDAEDAMICTFECTFCRTCADGELAGNCPNCGGNLCPRPRRPEKYWQTHPAAAGD